MEEHGSKGLVVLAINAWDENPSVLQRFVSDKQLRQQVLVNGSSAAASYGIEAVPAAVFIDRNGIVRNYLIGADSSRLRQHALDLMPP